ncbi:MAG: riboflavin biosynthesis protein RibF [Lactobacillus sp.]|nr:riboflavin biosynthesis protein RibF [Lactobacillus sp.]MCH3906172.1 riboflavin biosynthesis protein RibF [Lactobacillus sp.]MCH3990251.1 riboflavin biosynthesis protein RibF [Lactobacillus sp.]MCH4069035.1 riboflavin biosynthesis protein RibF [Lactobacillus sp.]MCI1303437.1 riboflavin biosynthesis protein RibF [Lactobacillus sp.]
MQVIDLDYPIETELTPGPIVLALGFFDGVHRGHQALLKRARAEADQRQWPMVVLTFKESPNVVFHADRNFRYLDSPDQKIRKMEAHGADYLLFADWKTGFKDLSPQEFVDQVIVKLQAKIVVAGFDYTYGRRDIANMNTLPGQAHGRFEVIEVPEQKFLGKKIGSTEIRQAIKNGDMGLAAELLGEPYVLSGKVVHGKRLGHKLGFPTLNLHLTYPNVIPKIGVYATRTTVRGQVYQSMTSVGYNITFNEKRKIYIESNLFGFDQEAYGQTIAIEWDKYLRGELDFANGQELTAQMRKDQVAAQRFFKKNQ